MLLTRLISLLPGRRAVLTVALSILAGVGIAITALVLTQKAGTPAPDPGPPHNQRFVSLGQAYLPQLGTAYAAAWEEGAKQLDAGKSVTSALDAVSTKWASNRTALFNRAFTPEFSRIVAESVKDSDVTPAERAALAAAWRGLALGLAR